MQEYVPVRLNTIRPGRPVQFDVYIKLPRKYLLYIHRGDSIENDRVKRLKKKRVRKLFITSEDEANYQAFLDACLEDAASSDEISTEDRANIVADYAIDAVGEMKQDPSSKKAYVKTQKSAQSIAGALKKDPEILKRILTPASGEMEDDASVESAVKCSLLAMKFAQALGLTSEIVENIGTAALVRDIAIYQNPEMLKLFKLPYDQFSKDDWKLYKEHPLKGAEILQDKDYVSRMVLELVATHEERKSGEGFPKGLTKLSKEQEILGLVSAYDRLVTVNKLAPSDAMQTIRLEEVGNFDLQLIKSFVSLLKAEGLVVKAGE